MPSLTHRRRGMIAALVSAVVLAACSVGVRPPVDKSTLTKSSSITITSDGAVVDRKDVSGQIVVKADNVTIRNSRVTSGSYYPIRLYDGFTGLRVVDTDVTCTSAKGFAGVVFNHYRAERVNVTGCKQSFPIHSDVRIVGSSWNGLRVPDYPATTSTTKPTTSTTKAPTTSTTKPPTTLAPTTQAPAPAAPPATNPPPSGFPTASTTGVPAGVTLTPSGSITVSTNGAVIDRKDVTGMITINADNVTIRRTRVTTSSFLGIRVNGRNAVIEDVDIVGTSVDCGAGIGYSNYTARRVDVSGCADGLKVEHNVTVESSYIHDQRKGPGTHNDALQTSTGSNIVIRNNRIMGPYRASTAAYILTTGTGPVNDVLVENNFLSGGGYTMYVVDKGTGYGPPRNVRVVNNVIAKDSYTYGWMSSNVSYVKSGNVYDTGGPA